MSGKSKFQISKSLDERIKEIASNVKEFEPEIEQVDNAFILGFNYANVSNYVGLTTDYQIYGAGLPVLGLVFFRSSPTNEDILTHLKPIRDYSCSSDGLGSFKADKNENFFLIYSKDNESNQVVKKIFDCNLGSILQEQPKLSVLDDIKIYNHSILVKLSISIKLDICENSNSLLNRDKIDAAIDDIKKCFYGDTKNLQVHLAKSNFSICSKTDHNNLTETFYDYLDAPSDLNDIGDYLPQMSKVDKQKMVDKWRNKMKAQRSPLEIELEHEDVNFISSESLPPESFGLRLEVITYLQANDLISKSIKVILFLLRQKLELLKLCLKNRAGKSIEPEELRCCTFKPRQVGHFIHCIYAIPSVAEADYKELAELRRRLHLVYLLPLDRPILRYNQRVMDLTQYNVDQQAGYLCNVHTSILDSSGIKGGSRNVIEGTYTYHHYMQNRINDSGWGCAYRSLQTIISWFIHQGYICSPDIALREPPKGASDKTNTLRKLLHKESRVPTHEEIQRVLVDVGDKESSFIGCPKWIGSQEVCYVLNHLYNLDSRFISVSSGSELVYKARDLGLHFATQSTPVMIGGGVLAHTMIGVDFNDKNGDVSYLILDPHYSGVEDLSTITKKGWCGWKKNSFWDKSAFYNLCLPQRPQEL